MTQPNEYFPPDSANYTSLAYLAARSEDDVTGALRSEAGAGHEEVLNQMYLGGTQGMSFTGNILLVVAQVFLGINLFPFRFSPIKLAQAPNAVPTTGDGETLVDIREACTNYLQDPETTSEGSDLYEPLKDSETGVLHGDLIPEIDASKVTTGTLDIAQIPTDDLDKDNIGDLQGLVDMQVNNFMGTTTTGHSLAEASAAQAVMFMSVQAAEQSLLSLISQITGQNGGGVSYQYDFSQQPDGTFPTDWELNYSGSGTGYLSIYGSRAHWVPVGDGQRSCLAVYDLGSMSTDYQFMGGTVSSPMGWYGAYNGLFTRCNYDRDTYVFCYGVQTGFFSFASYLGCVVDGDTTIFAGPVASPANYNLYMRAGTADDPRQFQVISGNTVIIDYTDTSDVSQYGSGYRDWGFIVGTDSTGVQTPGDAILVACADNAPA